MGRYAMAAAVILLMTACGAIRPDRQEGTVFDSSRNLSTVLYDPIAKPDNPFPIQSLVFIRHFYYFTRSTPWTIVSSGDISPGTQFEEAGVYLLRLKPGGTPLRLVKIPDFHTDGVTPLRAHLAVAAPSVVVTDGVPLVRNTSGPALVHIEDGPLYGGFMVDIPDTAITAEQFPRLLVDTRVRAAALAFDGAIVVYVDDASRVFTLNTINGTSSKLVIDIRTTLGPVTVTSIQWGIGTDDVLFVRLDRGLGPEAWRIRVSTSQMEPAGIPPDSIQEPGADMLPVVDQLTRDLTPGIWQVPAPERFAR